MALTKERIVAAFWKWDVNGDGVIDEHELRRILVTVGIPENDVMRIFEEIDVNNDGIINYEEFFNWIFGSAPTSVQDLAGVDSLLFNDAASEIDVEKEVSLKWQPGNDVELSNNDRSVTVVGKSITACYADTVVSPLGTCAWTWRFTRTAEITSKMSWVEVGIVKEGGDVSSDVISLKCATPDSSVQTAIVVLADGDLHASLDMDLGTFTITTGSNGGPQYQPGQEFQVKDPPDSVHTGVGDLRGQLWRPFVRLSRAEGVCVELLDLKAKGRAAKVFEHILCGNTADASDTLRGLLPGSGGQPGPRFKDMQCIVPRDPDKGRGALYISPGAAAIPRNLELIKARAVLRVGTHFQALPEGLIVKVIRTKDLDGDLASIIDESNKFLEEQLSLGHNILVHCGGGVSRSPAALTAFLMFSQHLRFKDALALMKGARKWAHPNPNFCKVLASYEEQLAAAGHFSAESQ